MWVLLDQGDAALVPSPSYPIHIFGPLFAGANVREIPLGTGDEFFDNMVEAWEYSHPKPRVIVLSFPHNPTTTCVDLAFMQRVVDFAREKEVVLVHDNAYADLGFDGYRPPSILQAEGAKEVAVELYSMTKSFSMAGWRVAFMLGNPEVIAALAKLKSLPGLRHVPADPDRRDRDHERDGGLPRRGQRDLPVAGVTRCAAGSTASAGRSSRRWARCSPGRRSPSRTRRWARSSSARSWSRRPHVALSPGVGFGPGGEGHVRFALIENEQRINQAMRNLRGRCPSWAELRRRRRGSATDADALHAEAHDQVRDLLGVLRPRSRCRRGSAGWRRRGWRGPATSGSRSGIRPSTMASFRCTTASLDEHRLAGPHRRC